MKKNKYQAVITAADFPTGQCTARALHAENINSVGIYRNINSPLCYSKLWKALYKAPDCDANYIALLKKLGDPIQKKVLFPCDDRAVDIISKHREYLKKYYHFVMPEKDVLSMMIDKTLFHQWAMDNGFLVPKSYVINNIDYYVECLREMTFPVIVKPCIKTFLWDKIYPKDKVLKFETFEDSLMIKSEIFKNVGKIIAQEFIPGRDSDIHFCLMYFDKNGKEKAYFTAKKIFQWPVGKGDTAATIGTDNKEVHLLTQQIFERARFSGIGSVEFKQSTKDKKYYITEPTVCRNDLQSFVAVKGGVNLSYIAYIDAVGESSNYVVKRKKSVFIVEPAMMENIKAQIKTGRIKFKSLINLLRGKPSFAIFSMNDLKPFVIFFKIKLFNLLK
jgi:D-aspartate ligase